MANNKQAGSYRFRNFTDAVKSGACVTILLNGVLVTLFQFDGIPISDCFRYAAEADLALAVLQTGTFFDRDKYIRCHVASIVTGIAAVAAVTAAMSYAASTRTQEPVKIQKTSHALETVMQPHHAQLGGISIPGRPDIRVVVTRRNAGPKAALAAS